MKVSSLIAAVLFAGASLSGASYADDKMAAPKAAEAQADKAKPHSHVQEKTGVPQTIPTEAKTDKPNAAKDKSKHYHPRDGK